MTTARQAFSKSGFPDPLYPEPTTAAKNAATKQARQDGKTLRAGKPRLFNNHHYPYWQPKS